MQADLKGTNELDNPKICAVDFFFKNTHTHTHTHLSLSSTVLKLPVGIIKSVRKTLASPLFGIPGYYSI